MVDGKAQLLREDYCDGLGDCLPACPTGAITFVQREAAAYDEAAVKEHLKNREAASVKPAVSANHAASVSADVRAAGCAPCSVKTRKILLQALIPHPVLHPTQSQQETHRKASLPSGRFRLN